MCSEIAARLLRATSGERLVSSTVRTASLQRNSHWYNITSLNERRTRYAVATDALVKER